MNQGTGKWTALSFPNLFIRLSTMTLRVKGNEKSLLLLANGASSTAVMLEYNIGKKIKVIFKKEKIKTNGVHSLHSTTSPQEQLQSITQKQTQSISSIFFNTTHTSPTLD